MWRLVLLAASVSCLSARSAKSGYEILGEILPHNTAAVSLHAVVNPFATSTIAGRDGEFRFKNVGAGTYTISIYVQHRGETRLSVEVGPGTADKRGRVVIKVDTASGLLSRNQDTTVSAREWQIPDRARHLYEEANRRVAKRDFDSAAACLRRAVRLAPQFAQAWNHLGTIAYQNQHYADAERYFRQGIQADPNAYEPLVNLGGVLINLGKLDEARKYNAEAVLKRPQDPLAQSQLGMTCMMMNDLTLAERHLLAARQLDPSHFSHPQLFLAELYLRRKDLRRAADQLDDFLQHHPDWPASAKMRTAIEQWRR